MSLYIIYCCVPIPDLPSWYQPSPRLTLDIFLIPGTALNNFLYPITFRHSAISIYQVDWVDTLGRIAPPTPIPAHPAPIPSRFPGRQVSALTTQASNSPLPVNPPPTDLHTDSGRESQPILNSPPTHTSSTVPTHSTSPVLQEPADFTIT